jgi:hypothetical protein
MVGSPSNDDTPEHNKMQAMFLKEWFQYAFIELVLGKSVYTIAQEAAHYIDKINRAALEEALKHSGELIRSLEQSKEYRAKSLKDSQTKAAKPLSVWQKEYEAEGKRYTLYITTPEERMNRSKEDLASDEKKFAEISQKLSTEIGRLAQIEGQLTDFKEAEPQRPDIKPDFECGFDVQLMATWPVEETVCVLKHGSLREFEIVTSKRRYNPGFGKLNRSRCNSDSFQRCIEIKPLIGDDFPSVLRQMKRNGADTLVVGSFNSSVCSLDEVRQMFAPRLIITLAEIKADQAKAVWPQ